MKNEIRSKTSTMSVGELCNGAAFLRPVLKKIRGDVGVRPVSLWQSCRARLVETSWRMPAPSFPEALKSSLSAGWKWSKNYISFRQRQHNQSWANRTEAEGERRLKAIIWHFGKLLSCFLVFLFCFVFHFSTCRQSEIVWTLSFNYKSAFPKMLNYLISRQRIECISFKNPTDLESSFWASSAAGGHAASLATCMTSPLTHSRCALRVAAVRSPKLFFLSFFWLSRVSLKLRRHSL